MSYEQKYLKYKTKYLELKQELEGGANGGGKRQGGASGKRQGEANGSGKRQGGASSERGKRQGGARRPDPPSAHLDPESIAAKHRSDPNGKADSFYSIAHAARNKAISDVDQTIAALERAKIEADRAAEYAHEKKLLADAARADADSAAATAAVDKVSYSDIGDALIDSRKKKHNWDHINKLSNMIEAAETKYITSQKAADLASAKAYEADRIADDAAIVANDAADAVRTASATYRSTRARVDYANTFLRTIRSHQTSSATAVDSLSVDDWFSDDGSISDEKYSIIGKFFTETHHRTHGIGREGIILSLELYNFMLKCGCLYKFPGTIKFRLSEFLSLLEGESILWYDFFVKLKKLLVIENCDELEAELRLRLKGLDAHTSFEILLLKKVLIIIDDLIKKQKDSKASYKSPEFYKPRRELVSWLNRGFASKEDIAVIEAWMDHEHKSLEKELKKTNPLKDVKETIAAAREGFSGKVEDFKHFALGEYRKYYEPSDNFIDLLLEKIEDGYDDITYREYVWLKSSVRLRPREDISAAEIIESSRSVPLTELLSCLEFNGIPIPNLFEKINTDLFFEYVKTKEEEFESELTEVKESLYKLSMLDKKEQATKKREIKKLKDRESEIEAKITKLIANKKDASSSILRAIEKSTTLFDFKYSRGRGIRYEPKFPSLFILFRDYQKYGLTNLPYRIYRRKIDEKIQEMLERHTIKEHEIALYTKKLNEIFQDILTYNKLYKLLDAVDRSSDLSEFTDKRIENLFGKKSYIKNYADYNKLKKLFKEAKTIDSKVEIISEIARRIKFISMSIATETKKILPAIDDRYNKDDETDDDDETDAGGVAAGLGVAADPYAGGVADPYDGGVADRYADDVADPDDW